MSCEHLRALEQALIERGFEVTFRGQAWEKAREWVYFDCYLPVSLIRAKFSFDPCVEDHAHFGTHDGQESGFAPGFSPGAAT